MRRVIYRYVILLSLLAVILAAGLLSQPMREWLNGVALWFRSAGAVGVGVFVGVYCLGALLMLPSSPFMLLGGFAYGLAMGSSLGLFAAIAAAWINFLVARALGRRWASRLIEQRPVLRAIDRATGTHGLRWVLLLRISPIVPFAALNYAAGMSGIGIGRFLIGGTLGKLPSTLAYSYMGAGLSHLSQSAERGDDVKEGLFWLGLVATLLAVVYITRVAQRELRKELDKSTEAPADAD